MSRTNHHGKIGVRRLPHYNFLAHWPRWHDKLFHIRPARRSESDLLRQAMRGEVEQVWPVNHKPRVYYW